MEEQLDIYVRGFGQAGDESPAEGLVRVFGLKPERAAELVASLPRVVKRRLSRAQAERYQGALVEIGAEVELRASPILPQRIIAVAGAEKDDTFDPNESGQTLTLPPPAPPSNDAHAGTRKARPAVMQSTVVLKAAPPPAAVAAEPEPQAGEAALAAPADVQAISLPPSVATVQIAPSPAAAVEPSVAPTMPLTSAWAELDRTPVARRAAFEAPLPLSSSSTAQIGSPLAVDEAPPPSAQPAPAEPPQPAPDAVNEGKKKDGRPDWLVDDAGYRDDVLSGLGWGNGSAGPVPSTPPLMLDVRAIAAAKALPPAEAPLELAALPAAAPAPPTAAIELAVPVAAAAADAHAAGARSRGEVALGPVPRKVATAHVAVGPRDYVPEKGRGLTTLFDAPLRVAFQLVLALLVFFFAAQARDCRGRGQVREAVAAWSDETSSATASSGASKDAEPSEPSPVRAGPRGQDARAFCESELNQFASGDKDVVRGLIDSLLGTGAKVTVGGIMKSGLVSIASELHIVLPTDVAKRRAVYEILRSFRASAWHMDPGEATEGDPFNGKAEIVFELS